ncbi:MAG: precorrin-2 C(20)-methyltransferase, partial [Oscillospiraceae bacterium]|nr:precorrin-2 C(20)-methyltransferase [Oscillospiraceae bacterium]
AQQSIDMSNKLIVPIKFLMSHNIDKTQDNHKKSADIIMEYLRQGHDIAMLNIGDISIYSTCSYILNIIEKNGFETEICAGVPSFCAAAARLKKPLVSRREVLVVAPGYTDELESLMSVNGTKVIMKSGKHMDRVKKLVEKSGMSDNAVIVESCGLENERIQYGIDKTENGYFSLMIVKTPEENKNA